MELKNEKVFETKKTFSFKTGFKAQTTEIGVKTIISVILIMSDRVTRTRTKSARQSANSDEEGQRRGQKRKSESTHSQGEKKKSSPRKQEVTQIVREWNDMTPFEKQTRGTGILNAESEEESSMMHLPAGVMEMLRQSRRLRSRHGQRPAPKGELPESWQSGRGRKLNKIPQEQFERMSVRDKLIQRAGYCFPTPLIDNQTEIPLTLVNTEEGWKEAYQALQHLMMEFGSVQLACIEYPPDIRRAAINRVKLPRHKFMLIATSHPAVYIIDCIAVKDFQEGLPDYVWSFIREEDLSVYGNNIAYQLAKDFEEMPTQNWTECQVLLEDIVGQFPTRDPPSGFGPGNVCNFFYGFDYTPTKFITSEMTFLDRYHPDAYGFGVGKGTTEFQQEYKIPGQMQKWELDTKSSGAIFGFLYTTMVMGVKIVLEFASLACKPSDTEKKAIGRILHHFKGLLPNQTNPDAVPVHFPDLPLTEEQAERNLERYGNPTLADYEIARVRYSTNPVNFWTHQPYESLEHSVSPKSLEALDEEEIQDADKQLSVWKEFRLLNISRRREGKSPVSWDEFEEYVDELQEEEREDAGTQKQETEETTSKATGRRSVRLSEAEKKKQKDQADKEASMKKERIRMIGEKIARDKQRKLEKQLSH